MDALHWLLLLLNLVLAAVVGWLLWIRSGSVAALQTARAERDQIEIERTRLAGDVDAARTRVEQLAAEAAGFKARAEGFARAVEETKADALRERTEALRAAERRFETERAGLERTAAAREEAAVRREADLRGFVEKAEKQLREAFGAAAGEQLKHASGEFLKLAQERLSGTLKQGEAALEQRQVAVANLVKPIADTLAKTDEKLAAIEKERASAYASIKTQVEHMANQGEALRVETGRLVQALRDPKVRGNYGERQLRRIAELAGMRAYCDFVEQADTVDADGKRLRPDMIVQLPNQRVIIVDAKTNIQPYLDALQATSPDAAEERLKAFADGVAAQATALGRKNYWSQFEGSAEFVVMFVPGDQYVDAALAHRPDLLDVAATSGVVLASPSSLIAMLRAVAVAFREDKLAREAEELLALGKELHERAATALSHVDRLGDALNKAVGHFNAFVGSYESRLEPTLRTFQQLGGHAKTLPELGPLAITTRTRREALPALGTAHHADTDGTEKGASGI